MRAIPRPAEGGGAAIAALVTAAMFVDAVFFALIAPLLPHYADTLGLNQFEVGLLFAAHPLGTVVCAAPAAVLVRRRGGRAAMTLGLAGLGVATIVFGFSASLPLLAACRFVQGASAALVWCGGLARLQAVAPADRRGAALGLAGSAAGAGSLFGPALAALCAALSVSAVLLALGALALVLCAALQAAGEVDAERRPGVEQPAASPIDSARAMARPIGVIVVCGTVIGAVATLAPLRLDELGVGLAAIAAIFTLSALGEMVASPLAGHLSDAVGRVQPMRISLVVAMPLLTAQATTASAWVMGGAVALTGGIVASLWPLGTALLADESSLASRSPASAFAASVVAWSSGLVAGSLLCGAIAQGAGDGTAYAALVVACAASLLSLLAMPAPRTRAVA